MKKIMNVLGDRIWIHNKFGGLELQAENGKDNRNVSLHTEPVETNSVNTGWGL